MEGDENLDLFSRRRRSLLISESNGHPETMKLEGKLGRSGIDLLSAELGKHDYDWLLTPPGTPLFPSSDATERQLPTSAPKNTSNIRSVSTTKASRFSVSQSEHGHSTRPARSISAMRPSISTTQFSSYYSNNNRTSILNTSSASVNSRPSTPGNHRSTPISSAKNSVPASRPVSSRSSTPVRTRTPSTSAGERPKPVLSSRPSTPTARTTIHTNSSSNSLAPRPSSRPSTPTRRTPAAPSATTTTRSPSVGRASTVNKPPSRPSSPAPRARTVQPITLPDFPLDVPPNLRTKLPERPASAGRTRPGMALTIRASSNTEAAALVSSNRRNSSPIATRGRFPENTPKVRPHSNGNGATPPDIQKSIVSEGAARKPVKPASTTESTGFGRNISKKSLDMALRHMDIRQNIGGIRGTSLFPHSIRSTPKGRTTRTPELTVPAISNGINVNKNGNGVVCEDSNGAFSENGDSTSKSPDSESLLGRASDPDPYGSYRYDAILLKEDSKNMNWLHSIEDKSDQSPEFDHRFEPLPEPFTPL